MTNFQKGDRVVYISAYEQIKCYGTFICDHPSYPGLTYIRPDSNSLIFGEAKGIYNGETGLYILEVRRMKIIGPPLTKEELVCLKIKSLEERFKNKLLPKTKMSSPLLP